MLSNQRNLKVAVLIGGQIREVDNLPKIIEVLKEELPFATIIGGAWNECKEIHGDLSERLNIHIDYRKPPKLNYSVFSSNPRTYEKAYQWQRKFRSFPNGIEMDRQNNQILMILAHNDMIKRYGHLYDVVIRVRWDHALGKNLQLYDIVEEVYQLCCVTSLCQRPKYPVSLSQRTLSYDSKHMGHLSYLPHIENNNIILSSANTPMIQDYGLIVHRSVDWDTDLVDDLFKKELLVGAEFGWYQCLIEYPELRYRHWDGGASIFRTSETDWKKIHF